MEQIHDHLFTNAKPGLTACLSLYGLGGVGKTQIAIQYAYLHKADYDIIYWLEAKDWGTLLRSFVKLSRDDKLAMFGAPRFGDEHDAFAIASAMKSWFEEETRFKWLLIFDNADQIRDESRSVVALIPKGQHGAILTTSRNRAAYGQLASEISEMAENEAIELLSKSSVSQDEEWSPRLVRLLGCLPLAIEQAASFIWMAAVSIENYIALYEDNQPELLNEALPISQQVYYQHTVATTWKVSFSQLEKQDPLACEILRLMIFLDGTNIQKDLFMGAGEVLDEDWMLSTASDLRLVQAFGRIPALSLIRPLLEDAFAVHLLVQQVMLFDIGEEALAYLVGAIKLVKRRFPWGAELGNFQSCLRYSAQAQSCTRNGIKLEIQSSEIMSLLGSLAAFFHVNG